MCTYSIYVSVGVLKIVDRDFYAAGFFISVFSNMEDSRRVVTIWFSLGYFYLFCQILLFAQLHLFIFFI